ncbi:MAG: lamin tail domain-containing protein [Bacteroidota bacterium]
MIRIYLFVVLVYSSTRTSAQLTEDFEDGNFKDGNPFIWTSSQQSGGDDFIISSGEVQSNGPAAQSTVFLSTDFSVDYNNFDVTWTFKVRYSGGAPSANNNVSVFLLSDRSDLTNSPEGYYIKMGENLSNDGIDLFSTSGGKIINDENDLVASSLNVHVRVTRTSLGLWTLEADNTGGDSFSLVGTANNTDFSVGSFFGFIVEHSSTNNDNFFIDDFTLTTTLVPDTEPPLVQSVSAGSSTEVDIRFNEEVDALTAEVTSNYAISGGVTISSATRDGVNPSLVRLVVSEFFNGETYQLTINGVADISANVIATNTIFPFQYLVTEAADFGDVVISEFLSDPENDSDDFVELFNRSDKFIDLSGWSLSDGSSTSEGFRSFVLHPDRYVIIYDDGATIDYASFGDAISINSLTLNNDDDQIELSDDSNNRIAFLAYTTTPEEGVSSELVNPNDVCISFDSYRAAVNDESSTPGVQNSVFDDTPDLVSPLISTFNVTDRLQVNFSETMDANSLMNGTYEVPGLTIDQIMPEGDFPRSVLISFIESVQPGTIYTLTISNAFDCSGNELIANTLEFGLGRPPVFNELLMTEIMSDPDPAVGLPEREFIELYNRTDELLSLNEITLADATSQVDLPDITLMPKSYYVLTSTSGASEFSNNSLGVPNFPSLNNMGERLILSREGERIFSIFYERTWHDTPKMDGGYSLEMKDVANPCAGSINWGSSVAVAGGTPATANSLRETIPDSFGPEVVNVVAISQDTIRIDFDEKIDLSRSFQLRVNLAPSLPINAIETQLTWPESLFIILDEPLVENSPATLSVSGAFDCLGNEVRDHRITFALPRQAVQGEILLNEVLFNPRVNGVDFVELVNSTRDFLSVKGWQLARMTDVGIADGVTISTEELVMGPGAYLAITTDTDVLFNNYPNGVSERFFQISSLPVYANDTGNVVLLDHEGVLQERFRYEEAFHYDLLESSDGVSLERISLNALTNDPNNWRSAASTAGFATPGDVNSQSISGLPASGRIQVDPKVFIPGNIGSGRDFTTINYEFDQPGRFADVTVFDGAGRVIKRLLEGALLATSGFLRWDGLTDSGTIARLGYYLVKFEVYDSSGNSEEYQETVVVGRDF